MLGRGHVFGDALGKPGGDSHVDERGGGLVGHLVNENVILLDLLGFVEFKDDQLMIRLE